jgi:hypothetical protein
MSQTSVEDPARQEMNAIVEPSGENLGDVFRQPAPRVSGTGSPFGTELFGSTGSDQRLLTIESAAYATVPVRGETAIWRADAVPSGVTRSGSPHRPPGTAGARERQRLAFSQLCSVPAK